MIKNIFYRSVAFVFSLYCRNKITEKGKFRIWKTIFRGNIIDKSVKTTGLTFFGARLRVDLSDFVQSSIYAFGVWEPVMSAYMRSALKEGDIFVDVGANIGYYTTLAASSVGSAGKVYAIEASPRIHKLLEANVGDNGIANANLINKAVADKPCMIPIWIGSDTNLGQTTIVEGMSNRASGSVEAVVEGLPLDQIVPLPDLLKARIIKIDVEGAEWVVLQGMKHVLPNLSDRTEIFVEACVSSLRESGTSIEEYLGVFAAAGFSPFVIDSQKNEPYYPLGSAGDGITPLVGAFPPVDMVDLLFRKTAAPHAS